MQNNKEPFKKTYVSQKIKILEPNSPNVQLYYYVFSHPPKEITTEN